MRGSYLQNLGLLCFLIQSIICRRERDREKRGILRKKKQSWGSKSFSQRRISVEFVRNDLVPYQRHVENAKVPKENEKCVCVRVCAWWKTHSTSKKTNPPAVWVVWSHQPAFEDTDFIPSSQLTKRRIYTKGPTWRKKKSTIMTKAESSCL